MAVCKKPADREQSRYLRPAAVAQQLGVSPSHVYAMIAHGEIPTRRLGVAILVPRAWLDGVNEAA